MAEEEEEEEEEEDWNWELTDDNKKVYSYYLFIYCYFYLSQLSSLTCILFILSHSIYKHTIRLPLSIFVCMFIYLLESSSMLYFYV